MNSKPTNFFSALFDFSFSDFVTPKIVGLIYFLMMVMAGIYAITLLVAMSAALPGGFLLALPIAVVIFIGSVIMSRIGLEVAVALFRIAQNTTHMARNTQRD